MKRKLLSAVLCCLIAATTQAAWAAGDPAEDEAWKKEPAYGKEIIVGYNGGLCLGTFGIAQMKGFYEAEGLKTKIVRMAGGSSAQTDAIGTGKVDVAGDHIATMLVGKYIAIPDGIGNSDHNIAMRFLNKDNVDPMKVKWKVVEAGASVLAMQNGEISAALLGDQFAKQFLDNGTLRIIRSLTFDEDFKKEACCIHAVSLDFYNQNPITVKKLTRAHEKASEWMMNNREEAVKILQANNWASGDYDLVLEIFNTYDFSISDELTEQTLRDTINDYKKFGLIDKNKDTEALIKQVWDPVLAD